MTAQTPDPPCYAVIFTSKRSVVDEGYKANAGRMVALAQQQVGYLGHVSIKTTERYLHVSMEALRRLRSPLDHLDRKC